MKSSCQLLLLLICQLLSSCAATIFVQNEMGIDKKRMLLEYKTFRTDSGVVAEYRVKDSFNPKAPEAYYYRKIPIQSPPKSYSDSSILQVICVDTVKSEKPDLKHCGWPDRLFEIEYMNLYTKALMKLRAKFKTKFKTINSDSCYFYSKGFDYLHALDKDTADFYFFPKYSTDTSLSKQCASPHEAKAVNLKIFTRTFSHKFNRESNKYMYQDTMWTSLLNSISRKNQTNFDVNFKCPSCIFSTSSNPNLANVPPIIAFSLSLDTQNNLVHFRPVFLLPALILDGVTFPLQVLEALSGYSKLGRL